MLDINLKFNNTQRGPEVELEGDDWSGPRVRTVKKLIDQAYNRWRRKKIRNEKESE